MEMADQKTVAKDAVSNNGVEWKSMEDFDPPAKPRRNKYAFACAILASMTSVLLGYGQFPLLSSLSRCVRCYDSMGRLVLVAVHGVRNSLNCIYLCDISFVN
ncbi:hypothetical protein NL676_030728 [Syzygium grande]|nr:hypothetical protein NL676_030728 [Syzygium grande]